MGKSQETPTGHSIPVPSREDVFRDLRKAAKAPADDESVSEGGAEDEQPER